MMTSSTSDEGSSTPGCAAAASTSSSSANGLNMSDRLGFGRSAARSSRLLRLVAVGLGVCRLPALARGCRLDARSPAVHRPRLRSPPLHRRAPRPRDRCAARSTLLRPSFRPRQLLASASTHPRACSHRRRLGPAVGSDSGSTSVGLQTSGILVPAMLARGAAHLPPFRRNCAVLHHILRAAIGAGEDHLSKSPLPGR